MVLMTLIAGGWSIPAYAYILEKYNFLLLVLVSGLL